MLTINPYLTFNGNCEEAFLFYKTVFGGEFGHLGRFAEMPTSPGHPPIPEALKDKVMHVSLPISGACVLMGSDSLEPTTAGNNFSLSINTKDKAKAKRCFDALSEGGKIKMPIGDTFWGSYFGEVIDQFGTQWMINCDHTSPSS